MIAKKFFIVCLFLINCGFQSLYKNSFLKNKEVKIFVELDDEYDRIFKRELRDNLLISTEVELPDYVVIVNNDIKEILTGYQSGIQAGRDIRFYTRFVVIKIDKIKYSKKDFFYDGPKEFGNDKLSGFSRRPTGDVHSYQSTLDLNIQEEKKKRFDYLVDKMKSKHQILCSGTELSTDIYINSLNSQSGAYQQSIVIKKNLAVKSAKSLVLNILQSCKD